MKNLIRNILLSVSNYILSNIVQILTVIGLIFAYILILITIRILFPYYPLVCTIVTSIWILALLVIASFFFFLGACPALKKRIYKIKNFIKDSMKGTLKVENKWRNPKD